VYDTESLHRSTRVTLSTSCVISKSIRRSVLRTYLRSSTNSNLMKGQMTQQQEMTVLRGHCMRSKAPLVCLLVHSAHKAYFWPLFGIYRCSVVARVVSLAAPSVEANT
jgi:hypothetical protein